MQSNDTVIALSGGFDSTTLLSLLVDSPRVTRIHCCFFQYGSKHSEYERKAAQDVVTYFKQRSSVELITHEFNLEGVMSEFTSALLKSSPEPIPEGEYSKESMKSTVVPGRNLIFASILAGFADSVKAGRVALGVHRGDHNLYADCRPEFLKALDLAVMEATEDRVELYTPFINEDKAGILYRGLSTGITTPYHLTRSCYKDQPLSCGKCGTCLERLEAFRVAKRIDPIKYEKE